MIPADDSDVNGPRPALRSAVIFDRDGTLNVDRGYTHDPADLVWIDGAREAIRLLNRSGTLVLVCTNQSGVARGYFDEDAVARFHEAMQFGLATHGAHIDAFYTCPYHPEGTVARYAIDHPDRKPRPGMIARAMQEWRVDPATSFAIGDRERDVEAARAAGLRGHLFKGGRLDEFVSGLMELGADRD